METHAGRDPATAPRVITRCAMFQLRIHANSRAKDSVIATRCQLIGARILADSRRMYQAQGQERDQACHFRVVGAKASTENWCRSWRRRPELNRGWRFCRPLPYRLATAPLGSDRPVVGWLETGRATCGDSVAWSWAVCEVERETGFEPATSTLARSHSTTELFPRSGLTTEHSS